MSAAISQLSDLMSIEQAARAVHMNRRRAKQLAIANGIAVRWGGTDAFPRLKVKLSELEAAILRNKQYEAGDQRHRPRRAPGSSKALHPDVRC